MKYYAICHTCNIELGNDTDNEKAEIIAETHKKNHLKHFVLVGYEI